MLSLIVRSFFICFFILFSKEPVAAFEDDSRAYILTDTAEYRRLIDFIRAQNVPFLTESTSDQSQGLLDVNDVVSENSNPAEDSNIQLPGESIDELFLNLEQEVTPEPTAFLFESDYKDLIDGLILPEIPVNDKDASENTQVQLNDRGGSVKRRSSEVELAEPKRKKRKKYEGIDFSEVTCWRINPDVVGELQLLDEFGNVLYTGPVQMSKASKKLLNGYLDINGKRLRRDSRDTENLEKNGFAIGVNDHVATCSFDKKRRKNKHTKYENVDCSRVKCWRINPDVVGELQLLDPFGNVLYTGPVQMSKASKKLPLGYLDINGMKLRRDIRDTEDLETNGFAVGQFPRTVCLF